MVALGGIAFRNSEVWSRLPFGFYTFNMDGIVRGKPGLAGIGGP